MKIILLCGIKHCGKTTLGRILAAELGFDFYDLDDLMLNESGGKWKSVRDIWLDTGHKEFHHLEENAARNFIEWIVPHQKRNGCVLALGGGTVENAGAMAWVGEKGTNVYISAEEDILYRRIMSGGCPPFLSEGNPRKNFALLYTKRDALYRNIAHFIHQVDDSPVRINAHRLIIALEKYYES